MSLTFVMRGATSTPEAPIVHGAYSNSQMDIRGRFNMQGPQRCSHDGMPGLWVGELFAAEPNLRHIALNYVESGVVFSKILETPDPEKPVNYRIINEEDMRAMCQLARIEIVKAWEIKNRYDGDMNAPWWLVQTKHGMIEFGWRKRVIHLEWKDTPVRVMITDKDVTCELDCVHAYSREDFLKHLTDLGKEFAKLSKE